MIALDAAKPLTPLGAASGACSPTRGERTSGALFALGLALVLAATAPAHADKVGVAAAVNPDAFSSLNGSPKTQLNIGKSIFYNEHINTTGSGLVQVLLIDGSTFTVGPGSDLTIDKFVYDPNKKTGQIAASFSKGVMRFVGGKISKNEGGVTVDTPAGALAIRGGMFQTNGKVYSFLYGDHMTLTGKNGQSYNVFQPGNSIDVSSGTPIVRPTTSADINSVMAALTNGSGGATGNPTGTDTGPTPGQKYTSVETLSLQNLISQATQTQINGQINDQEQQGTTETGTTPPPPETVQLPTQLSMRVLTAPDVYVANKNYWRYGTFIGDPGDHGILGGDDQRIPCFVNPNLCGGSPYGFFQVQTDDFNVRSSSIENGRVAGSIDPLIERTGWWSFGKTGEGSFDFPIFNVVGVHAVTDAKLVDDQGHITTLTGSAFTGRGGGFFAYQLFSNSDRNDPVLAFGGDTFAKPQNEPDQVRLFNLYTDPRQDISIPFASAATSPANLAGATVQPLFLREDATGGHPVWLQTSFLIQGDGPDQQTILVVALGQQNEDGQLVGFRRGMSHVSVSSDTSSFMQTYNLSGSIATLGTPTAQQQDNAYLFGDTLPHFVIGADSTGPGHNIFQDSPLLADAPQIGSRTNDGVTDGQLGSSSSLGATYHVGEQIQQVAAPAAVTTDTPVDFYGYAAGIYQQSGGDGSDTPVGMLDNQSPDDVHLKFKAGNTLSALFNLTGAGDHGHGGASLAFGDWNNAHGRSAVINGNIYAAIESATVPSFVRVNSSNGGDTYLTRADASLYLASGSLLNPSVSPCQNCDFMKWGTWGGQLKFRDGSQFGFGPNVTADVNLGWYVAGDITTAGQLEDSDTWLATGPQATYAGSAIGNVANNLDGQGWKTYVASGDLLMNWNFADRSGDLTISHFDKSVVSGGLTFSGPMCAPGVTCGGFTTPTGNHFGGPLTTTASLSSATLPQGLNGLSGNAVGSFVNNGSTIAAGVIGNWAARNDFYGVTGVFAGKR